MGLPLFVAPVESDLPSKAADKTTTSPSRSNIRRHGRAASRERRAALRRHMSIRDRLSNPPLRTTGSSAPNRLMDPMLDEAYEESRLQRARPFREVLREMARSDDRNRERFEEQLHSLFTGTPLRERSAGDNDVEDPVASIGLSTDPLPAYARSRLAATSDSRQSGADSRPRSRRWMPPLTHHPGQWGLPTTTDGTSQPRRSAPARILPSFSTLVGGAERLGETERNRDVNGLGDRERSLSPEVWDTLLSTLTPDPQPPSAGSSFASTVASQNAGASSGSALTTPELAGAAATDQACESGCENSDTEDADLTAPTSNRRRREEDRLEEGRRVRVRVPDYNLDRTIDGPLDGPADGPFSRRGAFSSEASSRRSARTRFLPEANQRERDEAMRETIRSRSLNITQVVGPRRLRQPRQTRSGWVGHLFVGNSDDEQGAEPRSLNREDSTMSGNATSQEEEDWEGMQRIVSSLVRREDIPDEWWAEVGLSRTLPQDGTD
ncbi:hypothetical protein B0T10DRAFT_203973 [Thelonectria olida]|uniref:Uncharacterized protein n=1 Tax=Thelonectria olida TaxID=1576542 RepID=A0A9P8VSE4_9HYPO|nr:hypothetical protein B0T10DRAFT_203973 [Thelonectria olida]